MWYFSLASMALAVISQLQRRCLANIRLGRHFVSGWVFYPKKIIENYTNDIFTPFDFSALFFSELKVITALFGKLFYYQLMFLCNDSCCDLVIVCWIDRVQHHPSPDIKLHWQLFIQNQNQKCIYSILTTSLYKVTMTIFKIRGPLLRPAWSLT